MASVRATDSEHTSSQLSPHFTHSWHNPGAHLADMAGAICLLTFFIGTGIANILLPVANLLDRLMPRFLAGLLSQIASFGLIVLLLPL